jgi:GTP-binding protein
VNKPSNPNESSGRIRAIPAPSGDLPVVVIIGRANVGKSTLFNRLVRRREAIVDDAPGITRDRKAADTEWQGRAFVLIDTGGYIPKGVDSIEEGVSRQVRLAIEEADLVLFICDVTTGITDVDAEIGRILRRSTKPVIVVANKTDHAGRVPDASEFIRLGLGEAIPVSAASGSSTGDLLALVVEKLGPEESAEPAAETGDVVRLAVVGRPNVGKSTFVNTVLGRERMLVSEIPGTTRDPVDIRFSRRGREFLLIDTAGMRRQSRVEDGVEYYSVLRSKRVIEQCDVACIMSEAEEGLTQQDLQVLRQAVDARKAVVLVMNKWDLVDTDPDQRVLVEDGLAMKLQGLEYVPVIFASSMAGRGTGKVLDAAWEAAHEKRKRISSPELNRFLERLNAETQPPAVQGKRVHVVYGTQAGANPPVFAFFANHPELIQESYKRFLENQIRGEFGFRGVPLTFSFRKK